MPGISRPDADNRISQIDRSTPCIATRGLNDRGTAIVKPTLRFERAFAQVLLIALSAAPFAAGTEVSADDYARAERLLPHRTAPLLTGTAENVSWLPNGTLWYLTQTPEGNRFVTVDPRRGTRGAVFDQSKMAAALSAAAGHMYQASHLPFRTFDLSSDGQRISFDADSKHWTCLPAKNSCMASNAPASDESLSPDKKRAAFIRNYNLWVRDVATGEERALTTDGVKDFGYATDNPGWGHSGRAILTWSPDSKKIATYQQDERGVGDMYLVDTRLGHPKLQAWKYPMAGDDVIATIQRIVIDVDTARVVRLKMPADAHRSSNCYDVQCGDGALADLQWSPDSRHFAFVSSARDHTWARLREADALSGEVREVLEESSPTFYESDISSTSHGAVNWRYLPAQNAVIWYSERSNFGHLYLYDLKTGELKHALTSGAWNVVEVLFVDAARGTVYFTGVGREPGRDPYYVHFYKAGLDGRDPRLLTQEDADHDISMAPSGRYFVDRYSTPVSPPTAVLKDQNGRRLMTLEQADVSALRTIGWQPPIPFTVKARDGATDLYGLMFRPAAFDSGRKYPIIDWVYPGPQIGSVGSRQFAASRGDRQSLAELGFIVIELDGMGTPFRSKKFHDVAYGDLIDNTLPDQVAGIQQLAQRYAWIDIDRVGIYGHSGGGYAAAAGMFGYPDFFKVGISESGNHDQRGYTDDWGEKFIGLLKRNPDGTSNYDGEDTLSGVKRLKGHLLLMHGTVDENVPPTLTLLMVDALIKANKDFDLLMLPNQRHYYAGDAGAYATRRRWDYFVRHLLGAEPPHEYLIGPSSEEPGPE